LKSTPALTATKDKICSLIDSGKSSQAAAVEDKLIADNSQDPCLPKIISDIADSRAELPCHDYGRAKALYNRLIQSHPQSDYAKRAALEISKINIFAGMEAGNLESADSDVEQLIAKHSKDPHFSEVLYDIAVRYTKRYYFDRADALYKRLIALCPADSFAEKAKFEQIKNDVFSKLMAGGDAVDGILNDTAAKYPDHKYLPGVFYFAADKYEENYSYARAKALYSQVLAMNPDSSYGRKSTLELMKLDIYEKISDGDFNSAQDLTGKLIESYPKHPYLPEVLYNIADYYRKCCNYERAKQVYSRLIELYPEDRYSSRASVEITLLDIRSKMALGTFDPAAGEIEQFISGRGKDYLAARRCYELGEYCLYDHNYEAAISVFQTVCRQFGEYSYYYGRAKICCDTAKICKEIRDGNLTNAQTGLAKLRQDYAEYYYLADQLYFIAKAYLDCGYQDQSGALCDEVINIGQGEYAALSNMFKYRLSIRSRLQADDLAGAKELFNEFKLKYADSLYLEEGIVDLAEEFYNKGLRNEGDSSKDYLKEVIAICQTHKPTEADLKVWVYTMLAQSNFRLGNFAESAYYHQKIVDEYPDSRFVWHAQFMVGRAYEDMQKAGGISEQEAAGRIEAAKKIYEEIIQNCPAGADAAVLAEAAARLKKYDLFSAIESGNDVEVKAVIGQLGNQLGDANERLDTFLSVLARECSFRGSSAKLQGDMGRSIGYFEIAIRLEERLFTQCPNSPLAAGACFVAAAQLAQEFEDYAGAAEYFQKVADKWPEYEHAAWAQLKAGIYLEAMVEVGELADEDAKPLIIKAYQAVIDNYPRSEWLERAQQKLNHINEGLGMRRAG
jgi:tetratricopeptide (TPR) repeat protein